MSVSVYHKDMDTLTQREIDAEFLRSFVMKVEGLLPEGVATCDECGIHTPHDHPLEDWQPWEEGDWDNGWCEADFGRQRPDVPNHWFD